MPKDPLPASSPGKLPTNEVDIGHVAPSFPDEELWNTLVVRAQYRISLRMGEIEPLFKDEPDTPRGRMARLQVLGLFYFPLGHSKAASGFNGLPATPAAGGNPGLPAIRGGWEYFKKVIAGDVDDAGADAEIQRLLDSWIIHDGRLPHSAEDPKKPEAKNFAKIRLPGGYSFLHAGAGEPLTMNNDASYALGFGDDLYAAETRYRTDNPVIGKIPLIATVEKLDPFTMEWKPAKDQTVYFQLQDPYELPSFDTATSVLQQFNRPPLRKSTIGPPAKANGAGPEKFAKVEEEPSGARKPDPKDPQRFNARTDRGGLAGRNSLDDGTDVANVVFATTSTPGFNAEHAPARSTKPETYPLAQQATPQGKSHRHAVRAMTNDRGEAGVIFTPSRCAGDRYRIRAYIGPADPANPKPHETDGTGMRACAVDTGTLIVWRNVRISRYIRQPASSAHQDLLSDFNTHSGLQIGGAAATNASYLSLASIDAAKSAATRFQTCDFSETVQAGFSTALSSGDPFEPIRVQWARAFVELTVDPGASLPEDLTAAEWTAVRQRAIADMRANQGAFGLNLDLNRLFFMDNGNITVDSSVTTLPMRHFRSYNTAFAAGNARRIRMTAAAGNNRTNIDNLFWSVAVPSIGRHLASNGFLPGLTLVQAGFGAGWQLWNDIDMNSGLAVNFRAGFVWMGSDGYPATINPVGGTPGRLTYNFTSNSAHELGHVQFRLHGPGQDPGGGAGGGNQPGMHDSIASNESVCVMSYQSCEGHLCAKCLFALRGWNIAAMP